MERHGVPTARYGSFSDPQEACSFIRRSSAPLLLWQPRSAGRDSPGRLQGGLSRSGGEGQRPGGRKGRDRGQRPGGGVSGCDGHHEGTEPPTLL